MRIQSSAAAHVDTDLRAARGDKSGSHTPGTHEDDGAPRAHDDGRSSGTTSPVNGASSPDDNSQDARLQQAFTAALASVGLQLVSNASASFDEAIAETEQDS
ncbi:MULTISPECIES: hypothetical protein [unclassified Bradyrhizobium]|uniref:hypothetical protein n=1 Tax=unclassified Bradyrhizobium TaxID=2631580 RepID=UPI00339B29AA